MTPDPWPQPPTTPMVKAAYQRHRREKVSGGRQCGFKSVAALIASGFVFAALVSGCSPVYVLQAAYEEGKILWRREPITDYLARSDLSADARAKLELVLAVRQYAATNLKMNVKGSYSSYS